MQVSDAVASQQQDLSQANNPTYLMEAFHKLVHDLEEPVGVRPASYTHPNAPSRPEQSASELLQWGSPPMPKVKAV